MQTDDLPAGAQAYESLDFSRDADDLIETVMVRLAHSGPTGLALIESLLGENDPEKRWWAARALAEAPGGRPGELLAAALRDHDLAVRQCAAAALRQNPASAALPVLLECLGSPDGLLRRLAGDALAALGAEAAPALIATLENGPEERRGQAARALALLSDKRAVPALLAALDDPSTFVAYWALEGLDKMGVGMTFFDPGR